MTLQKNEHYKRMDITKNEITEEMDITKEWTLQKNGNYKE